MTTKVPSPVEQFYIDLEEQRRLEAIEALKTKRGRPRKTKMYFTLEAERAIIAYNKDDNQVLKYTTVSYINH